MLSGETANGDYPVDAVATMAKIALETENNIDYHQQFMNSKYDIKITTDVISHSAVDASFVENVKSLVVFTNSGNSARMISRFQPSVTVIGATPNERVYRQLELYWGVNPVLTPVYNSVDEMFDIANVIVKTHKLAKAKDNIVITCGTPKQAGCTNLIKIQEVK